MKREYKAIVDAGFILQIDCPDLALGRHTQFAAPDASRSSATIAAMHVEVLEPRRRRHPARPDAHPRLLGQHAAARTIATCRSRTSSTSSSRRGRAARDRRRQPAPRARVEGVEGREAPRGQGARRRRDRLHHATSSSIPSWWPSGSCATPSVVGRENVIAGVDCGFGTFAGRVQVDTNIVWHKLRALVEGAGLASRALW